MEKKELLGIIDRAKKIKWRALYLSRRNLKELPEEICQITGLMELDLSYNQFEYIPDSIGHLNNLQCLNLSRNKITSIPDSLGQLSNLKILDLYENQIKLLPDSLGQLFNLTWFGLSNNQLMHIPDCLGRLHNLEWLGLSSNNLTSIPDSLGDLNNLKELRLSCNQITSLPSSLARLKSLQALRIAALQIDSIPNWFVQLNNLQELWLSNNQFKFIPDWLGQLGNLQVLRLTNIQLKSVPDSLGQLINLRRLALSKNLLTSVPDSFRRLSNLKQFDISDNQLTSVPYWLGELSNLRELRLAGNKLISIPDSLGQLSKLRALWLFDNRLASIPDSLGRLRNLRELRINNNPLKSPPANVVSSGTKVIIEYLRELNKGAGRRFEAKLLILGDGGEGKTCVSRALRALEFKEQVRTEGVEVVEWRFTNTKSTGDISKEITLNIWDFEGQEINHQSHQFFLTEGALYLLVINGRKRFRIDRAEYWLDTIRARAPGSRVILVASECESTTPSWPLDKLKASYGDLLKGEKWFFAVGCENREGVDDLTIEVKRATAEIIGEGMNWPVTYTNAEEKIRQYSKKETQVSKAELYGIFKESGISEEGFEGAAMQIHSLGLITQFRDSPALEDFVVLNPQWLTKGISKVMEDERLDKDKGEISHKRMKEIWDDEYKGLYPVLHNCMKEFELCYDMEDKEGCLVPLRFGDARPGDTMERYTQSKRETHRVSSKYQAAVWDYESVYSQDAPYDC